MHGKLMPFHIIPSCSVAHSKGVWDKIGYSKNSMVTARSGQSICELEKVEPKFDTQKALKHVVEHHEKQPSHCQPSVGDSPTRASCQPVRPTDLLSTS